MGITYSYYIKLFYSPFLKFKYNGLNGQKQKLPPTCILDYNTYLTLASTDR